MKIILGILFFGIVLGFQPDANAGQKATVIVESLEVHEAPTSKSPLIVNLTKGKVVLVSFRKTPDDFGVYWFKVLVEPGKYGYAEVEGFRTTEMERDLRGQGVSTSDERIDDEDTAWTMAIRAMILGGGIFPVSNLQWGGETELSFCIPFEAHGYLRRFLAAGPFFTVLSNDAVIGASIVLRLYTSSSLVEPEFRFRGGFGAQSQAFYTGLSFALRFPFTNYTGPHLAGYTEIGSLTTLDFNNLNIFGAAGIGFHF
ncbi:MAG: hypothetical protein HYX41_06440 [Bdellovibrio sp.]|nr:hypothetical protein [Bdellovibrio sp.]